jgi:ribosomal protein S18 acetylase RimI-like enzyme
MNTEFRRAVLPEEIRSLVIFDHKAFHKYPADWFRSDDWNTCEPWWMLVDGRKVGCCGFERHVDFGNDIRGHRWNPSRHGSLYIVTTGILPEFQRLGLGMLLKNWQVAYARVHGFTRIVTNTRMRNQPMIQLNLKFGFKVIRTTPGYYQSPREATVVMELLL